VKVVFRADASPGQGTGHVMRCLTLAQELRRRGHDTHLMTGPIAIEWLLVEIRKSGILVHSCDPNALPSSQIKALQPDWVVVDSYLIDAVAISALAQEIPTLAIFDGDDRGIDATLYLEQNLGAESSRRPTGTEGRYLAGARYALVRDAVLQAARAEPWMMHRPPTVLCFMGGTDPTQSVVGAVRAIDELAREVELTAIAPPSLHQTLHKVVTSAGTTLRLLAPSPELPSLLARADIVVSAAGTSTWDVCTLGIPSVFVAVVENQAGPLREVIERGLALGVDVVEAGTSSLSDISGSVALLLDDGHLRERLSKASRMAFDGGGARRVAERLERGGYPVS
jgi:UDP-2,4-diacetamido-2,4,6-trideoxy-beta-L-altropyranose hydrolase